MFFSGSRHSFMDHSMFDWPLHNQTSPTRTFLISTLLFAPLIVSLREPVLLTGRRETIHLPSLSAEVPAPCPMPSPSSATDTCSPGSALPQMGIFAPC